MPQTVKRRRWHPPVQRSEECDWPRGKRHRRSCRKLVYYRPAEHLIVPLSETSPIPRLQTQMQPVHCLAVCPLVPLGCTGLRERRTRGATAVRSVCFLHRLWSPPGPAFRPGFTPRLLAAPSYSNFISSLAKATAPPALLTVPLKTTCGQSLRLPQVPRPFILPPFPADQQPSFRNVKAAPSSLGTVKPCRSSSRRRSKGFPGRNPRSPLEPTTTFTLGRSDRLCLSSYGATDVDRPRYWKLPEVVISTFWVRSEPAGK